MKETNSDMNKIPFNKAIYLPQAFDYMNEVMRNRKIAGDGKYTKLCSSWMEERFSAKKVLMTTSCTAALEMCALLLDLKPGDEVIMPSYTFVSTASAFVLRGCTPVFVDVRPDTMNIDEQLIESAITTKTRAIVVVHYGGVSCEMDKIMSIAKERDIPVIEDAAQGVMSSYKGHYLGTIGTFGCYSFHETKNYTMGEGGALVINDPQYIERAEVLREKGTNRTKFYKGEIDKYTWVDLGSSFLPSEINVSYLYGQLEKADEINQDRLNTWNSYFCGLDELFSEGILEGMTIPAYCKHNAHLFYIKTDNEEERTRLLKSLKDKGIFAVFHYVPLHSSTQGKKVGRFSGDDQYTTRESGRLIRLPLYYGMKEEDVNRVVDFILEFYWKKL